METMSWTTVDKSTWAPGPWHDEPDKMQWPDEATGLPLLIHRSDFSGAWCGYVGVPKDHPWHEMNPFKIAVDVHGGLNFATFCMDTGDESRGICHVAGPGEPDHVYWIGFDCGHAFDAKPSADAFMRSVAPHLEEMRQSMSVGIFAETYRDLAYAREQCRLLAAQVAGAA